MRRQISKLTARISAGSDTLLSRVEHPRILALCWLPRWDRNTRHRHAEFLRELRDEPCRSIKTDLLSEQVTSASVSTPKLGWPIFPETAGIHTLVDYAFSSVQPANSYDLVEAVEPEEQTKLGAQGVIPTELVEAEPVPLPTRKPKRATATSNNSGGERVHVASKRLSQARARKSKQMKFGTIGFNYAGPAM